MASKNPIDQKNHLLGTVSSQAVDGGSIYGSYAFQRVVNVQKQIQTSGVVFTSIQESYQDGQLASQLDYWSCQRLTGFNFIQNSFSDPDSQPQKNGQKIKDHLEYERQVASTLTNYFTVSNNSLAKNVDLSSHQQQTKTETVMFNFFKKNNGDTSQDQVLGGEIQHQIHEKFENTFAPQTDDQGTSFVQPMVSGMITGKVSNEAFGQIHQSNFRTDHSQHDGQDLDGDGYIDTPWGMEEAVVQSNQITEFLVRDILDKIHYNVDICIKTNSDPNLLILAREAKDPNLVVNNPDQLYPLNHTYISQIDWTKVSEILFRWEMGEVMAKGLSLEYIAANLRQAGYSIEAGSDGGVHRRYIRIVV